MTDPEATAQDPAAAPPPAAGPPWVTGQQTVTATAPAAAAPRRRRHWVTAALAAVAVAGLAAGLVVWAPWIPPPVLRPAGLKAGPATANSVTLRWSRPPTGPLPDKYLIISYNSVDATAAGTATSYRQAGLTPATAYQYRVVAVRGGKRSRASALLTLDTITPPLSQARLQGPWNVTARYTYVNNFTSSHRSMSLSWKFSPLCPAGACDVKLRQRSVPAVSVKLTRKGAAYYGQVVTNSVPCGTGAGAVTDPLTLKIRIHVTAAGGISEAWAATSWTGTVTGTSPYAASSTIYCDAGGFRMALKGAPG